jgi:tetratricopeptide (TPR) repeat protein
MTRRVRWVAAGVVVIAAVALVAGLGWSAGPRATGIFFLLGAALLLLGACVTAARLVDGLPSLREGLIAIALGAAILGFDWVDGWMTAETTRAKVRVALDRGQAAAKAGDWAAAADAYSEAIQLDPDNSDALRRRGSAYLHLRENDRALADLDAAGRLRPDDAGTAYNRGLARARLGDATGALADFTEAIRLDPTLARAYQARGTMHARAGNAAQAEADWQRAAELDPALNKGGGLDL